MENYKEKKTLSPEYRHQLVGPANLWRMKRQFQFDFILQQGLKPSDGFLDIGCGTLRGGLPVIEYLDVGRYYGIEARKDVLEQGRQELEEAGSGHKLPTLIGGIALKKIKLDVKFDFIWSFSVLFHMSDEILFECLHFVAQYMNRTGRFFANVHYGDKPDGFWQGFPVVYRDFAQYKNLGKKNCLEVTELGLLKDFGHVSGVEQQDTQMMLEFRHP